MTKIKEELYKEIHYYYRDDGVPVELLEGLEKLFRSWASGVIGEDEKADSPFTEDLVAMRTRNQLRKEQRKRIGEVSK